LTCRAISIRKGHTSRSPGSLTQRGLNAKGGCSGQRSDVFRMGNYCFFASIIDARSCSGLQLAGSHCHMTGAQLVTFC